MAEAPDELRSRLAELHQQLQGTRSVSSDIRNLLVEVLADIDRLLLETGQSPAASTAAAAHDQSSSGLAGRLADAAQQFEETHPQLAANLGSVVTALSRLGI